MKPLLNFSLIHFIGNSTGLLICTRGKSWPMAGLWCCLKLHSAGNKDSLFESFPVFFLTWSTGKLLSQPSWPTVRFLFPLSLRRTLSGCGIWPQHVLRCVMTVIYIRNATNRIEQIPGKIRWINKWRLFCETLLPFTHFLKTFQLEYPACYIAVRMKCVLSWME